MTSEPENKQLLPAPCFFEYSYEKYKTFKCNLCGLGFKIANDLRIHQQSTFEEKTNCLTCNQVFSTVKGMKQHYGKVHSKNRPSRCIACRKRFRNKYALKFHVLQVHDKTTREDCPHCHRSMYNNYSLNRHLKICKNLD